MKTVLVSRKGLFDKKIFHQTLRLRIVQAENMRHGALLETFSLALENALEVFFSARKQIHFCSESLLRRLAESMICLLRTSHLGTKVLVDSCDLGVFTFHQSS